MPVLHFPSLEHFSNLEHGFTLRENTEPTYLTPAEDVLSPLGLQPELLVQAEQPHGAKTALVHAADRGCTVPDVDALITNTPEVILTIRTADCGPVYLYDPEHRAIGLVHSGRKGTELNIVQDCIQSMRHAFGSLPAKLTAVLGPCIRPPDYEIDFAADIMNQLRQAGVLGIYDCALNTAADLERFYSYRLEKGETGRHYAYLGLKKSSSS